MPLACKSQVKLVPEAVWLCVLGGRGGGPAGQPACLEARHPPEEAGRGAVSVWKRLLGTVLTTSGVGMPSNAVSFSFQGAEAVSSVLAQACHFFLQPLTEACPVCSPRPARYFSPCIITFQRPLVTQDP